MKMRISNKKWLAITLISSLVLLSNGIFGTDHRAYATLVTPITTAITGGDGFSLSLDKSGTVWGWGNNSNGTLGDGTTTDSLSPVKVSGLNGKTMTSISAKYLHSLALASNGTVWAWGNNSYGQLGNNSVNDSSTSVQVIGGLTGKTVTAIATGMSHSLALTSSGTVYAWGNNSDGQLGINSTHSQSTPVQISTLSSKTIIAIAAGNFFSMALASDGSVWAWGNNGYGQLGDGGNTTRLVPVVLIGLTGKNIIAIAAGNNHALALASGDKVWAVGANNAGQLGDGTNTNRSTWVRVMGLVDPLSEIAAASDHSYFLKDDGAVLATGENDRGQLGDGALVNRSLPNAVSGLSGINTIASGTTNGLAIDTNGIVWSWGGNDYGQLGNKLYVDTKNAVASVADLAEAVSIDKAAIEIGYQVGDSATSVTSNITLPTSGAEGSTISWSSSDGLILSNTGVAIRKDDGDKVVTLTASLTKGSIVDTREFVIKVLQTDAYAVSEAKAALVNAIVYATNDTNSSVTKDIYLPTTGLHNATIVWAPDPLAPTVMDATGKVVRPETTKIVTLTATITRGSNDTLQVPFTVLGQSDLAAVNEVKDAIVVGFSSGDSSASVTKNLTLPTLNTNGVTVLWHSDDSATISNSGVVTPPTDADKTVTLTADISRNVIASTLVTYSIVLSVPQTTVGSIASAKAALDIGYTGSDNASNVNESLTLPLIGASGTTISWVSDTPIIVSTTGIVTRYALSNKTVKLTATINKNNSASPQTKVFTLTVIQTDVGAIAAAKTALAVGFGSGDSLVKVTKNLSLSLSGLNGTTISWGSSDNTIIDPNDGTVKRPSNANTSVTLTATIHKNVGNDTTKSFILKVLQTDDGAVAATLAALTTGFNDSNNRTIFAVGDSKTNATKKLTLPITNIYGVKITWTTAPTEVAVPPVAAAISTTGVVTRNPNMDKSVEITATVYRNTTNSVTFTVIVPQSEAGAIAQAKAALAIGYTGTDNATNVNSNVTLPTSGAVNTTITWATNKTKVITATGVVTRQVNANTKVVLTATIKKNGVKVNVPFNLTVPQTDNGALAAAKTGIIITYSKGDRNTAVTQNVYLKLTGTNGTKVIWSSSNAAVIDSTGLVQRSALNEENITLTARIWKDDIANFTENIFLLKVLQTEDGIVAKAKADLSLAYADNSVLDINAVTKNLKLATKNMNGAIITWTVDLANTRVISRAGAVTRQLDGNKTVTLTATIAKNKTKVIQDFTVTVLRSDLSYVRLDKDALEIAYTSGESILSVTKNITLSTSGLNGTTIIWTSSNQSVISTTGVVTPLGNKDSKVTLTATIKKNTATDRKSFILTVPQTDIGSVGAAKQALAIGYTIGDKDSYVTQKITLPTSGANGVTITWNSLNKSVISDLGEVTRLASDNTVVQLVATLARNGVTDTKPFYLTVPQSKEGAVAMANTALAIGLSSGDSDLLTLTKKITLPLIGTNGTTISWLSSLSNVVGNSGAVTRQASGDTDVTLTATIKKKDGILEYTENKQFILKVLQSDAGAIAAANAALVVGYGGADSASSVTQNVTLASSGTNGTEIAWSSSNAAVLSISGVITPIADKKTTVRLTATITKNGIKVTKVFTLIV